MRELNGYRLESTAITGPDGGFVPALRVSSFSGEDIALFEVGGGGDSHDETAAHVVAKRALDKVVKIANAGRALFFADGAVSVRLVR